MFEALSTLFEGMSLIRKQKWDCLLISTMPGLRSAFGTKIQEKINLLRISYHCQALEWKTLCEKLALAFKTASLWKTVCSNIRSFAFCVKSWGLTPEHWGKLTWLESMKVTVTYSLGYSGKDLSKLSQVLTVHVAWYSRQSQCVSVLLPEPLHLFHRFEAFMLQLLCAFLPLFASAVSSRVPLGWLEPSAQAKRTEVPPGSL